MPSKPPHSHSKVALVTGRRLSGMMNVGCREANTEQHVSPDEAKHKTGLCQNGIEVK